MNYIQEFRDQRLAAKLIAAIEQAIEPGRTYRLMEFCGGHTHSIHRYGLPSILPPAIQLLHGPGCPVCILPIARLDQAMALANRPEVILCSYADLLRLPGTGGQSLLQCKARGARVQMVYSVDSALALARENPDAQVVFFAIGFETTTPPTAAAILAAAAEQLSNFSVFCNHVLTPVAMRALLADEEDCLIDGFIGPAHVSIVIGSQAYAAVAGDFAKPIVISGFEPLDVLHSILLLVEQINQGGQSVVNQYTRAVSPGGNERAQALVAEVFALRDQFEWRGLGFIPESALRLRPSFADFDAEQRFEIPPIQSAEHKACQCPGVLRGKVKPTECSLFATACTPHQPLGSCMVSSEGACAAVYAYGRA